MPARKAFFKSKMSILVSSFTIALTQMTAAFAAGGAPLPGVNYSPTNAGSGSTAPAVTAPTPGMGMGTTSTTSQAPTSAQNAAHPATAAAAVNPNDPATRPVPEKVLPYVREGYLHLSKGAYDRAIKSLRQAIAMDKDCISARRYLAYALIQKGQAKEALSVMQTVSKMVQANAFDFYLFGAAYYAAGGTKEAKDCYNEALRQNPRYDAARAGLICSLTRQHNYEEALNAVRQGLQLTDSDATKRYYNSLSKAVLASQAYQQQSNNEGLVPGNIGSASTQVGGDAVKSAPIIIK